jgi:hypothetical protein
MAVQSTRPPAMEPASVPRLERKDQWWVAPLTFFVVFSAFAIWATFRAFQNGYYATHDAGFASNYLSPFYSPTIKLNWHIGAFAISPALLILPFPLSFRLSCYYYRKALYRSYLADPLACAVTEPAPLAKARFRRYRGERAFPLIVQNFHRFAFYAAVVFIVVLWKDTVDAFFFTDNNGATRFGIGLGSLVFLTNIVLLTLYTFSCHSWRHLIGGGANCYSCSLSNRTKYGLWKKVSFLNESHGRWAMMSLCSVALTDVYVWLVASGRITDLRFF